MKEIKYRAWIRNCDWDGTDTTPEYKMYHWDDFFFSDTSPVTGYSDAFPDHNDPEIILMQYVGMSDKNGVDIYEDDIIYKEICDPDDPAYGSYGDLGIVKEDPHDMGWYIEGVDTDSYTFYDDMGINFSFDEIKVVGNEHENPELLE